MKPTHDELLAMYVANDMPSERIGRQLGVSGRQVRYWLAEYGITPDMRPRRELAKFTEAGKRTRFNGTQGIATRFAAGHHPVTKGHTKGTSEVVARIAAAKRGRPRPDRAGPLNQNWKGGVTPAHEKARKSVAYAEWRAAVFRRDDFTCTHCATRGVRLEAHHIKPFATHPELRLDVANGATLCVHCHREKPRPPRSARFSDEHRRKLSEAQKHRWADPEERRKQSERRKRHVKAAVQRQDPPE